MKHFPFSKNTSGVSTLEYTVLLVGIALAVPVLGYYVLNFMDERGCEADGIAGNLDCVDVALLSGGVSDWTWKSIPVSLDLSEGVSINVSHDRSDIWYHNGYAFVSSAFARTEGQGVIVNHRPNYTESISGVSDEELQREFDVSLGSIGVPEIVDIRSSRGLSFDRAGRVTTQGLEMVYDPQDIFDDLRSDEEVEIRVPYRLLGPSNSSVDTYARIIVRGFHAEDDFVTTDDDSPVSIDVLFNDHPGHNDPLTILSHTQPDRGIVSLVGNTLVFDPNDQFYDTMDGEIQSVSFSYTIEGPMGLIASADVRVDVTGSLMVVADTVSDNTYQEIPILLDLLENANILSNNDTYNNTSPDIINIGDITLSQINSSRSITLANLGVISTNDNILSFDPRNDFNILRSGESAVISVPYTLQGPYNTTRQTRADIVVHGFNADPDYATTDADTRINIDVLANDHIPDRRSEISIISFTQPPTGTVSLNGDRLRFDPRGAFDHLEEGQTQSVSFSYTIEGPMGARDTADVSIIVEGTSVDEIIISQPAQNLDLCQALLAEGWIPGSPATVVIESGVNITATSTSHPALFIGDCATQNVTLVNNGVIAGMGGRGGIGVGGPGTNYMSNPNIHGQNGGPAIRATGPITIDNQGIIGGGGGGGGGGSMGSAGAWGYIFNDYFPGVQFAATMIPYNDADPEFNIHLARTFIWVKHIYGSSGGGGAGFGAGRPGHGAHSECLWYVCIGAKLPIGSNAGAGGSLLNGGNGGAEIYRDLRQVFPVGAHHELMRCPHITAGRGGRGGNLGENGEKPAKPTPRGTHNLTGAPCQTDGDGVIMSHVGIITSTGNGGLAGPAIQNGHFVTWINQGDIRGRID